MNINTEAHNACETLKNGGIILYPTDTVWGLGCDATNEEAVQRIYEIKKRSLDKKMVVLVNGDRMLFKHFKDIPQVAWELWELSEKPLTLILDDGKQLAKNLIADDGSLGVRWVKNHEFSEKLLQFFGKPIVATSANVSDMPFPKSFKDIHPEILKGADYIVKVEREVISKPPSTIMKLGMGGLFKIVRR